jgi:hypothetical protein
MDKPFSIGGPTVLVGAAATQLTPQQGTSTYRVLNLSTSIQRFTVGSTSSMASLTPAAGVPAPNTITMLGSSVETFSNLPGWMIASSATGFEVTPGDGV